MLLDFCLLYTNDNVNENSCKLDTFYLKINKSRCNMYALRIEPPKQHHTALIYCLFIYIGF